MPERRVDVLALTDHDEIRGARRARDYARAHPELGVDVVVGEEISTLNGHLLGLFLAERVPPQLPALETIELIHAQGGLAVAAHPFHPIRGSVRGHYSIGRMVPDLPLDAIEIVNNAGFFSWIYDAAAAIRKVTRFEGRDAGALRRALETGRTRAHVNWSWTADKVPRHLHIQVRSLVRFLWLTSRPPLTRRAR